MLVRATRSFRAPLAAALLGILMIAAYAPALHAQSLVCNRTFTTNADFDLGVLNGVNHNAPNGDQLQLNTVINPFPFVNIACSNRGTVVRVDVNTGAILGEYATAPAGRLKNPSRTTVDLRGNVWVSNRDENYVVNGVRYGSCMKIGIVIGGTRCDADRNPTPTGEYLMPPFDYCTAVDRNGDGLIRTSYGLSNILAWPNITDGSVGANGIVEDAVDECILLYMFLPNAEGARHISVDADNNVWVAGYPYATRKFHKLDQNTGAILATIDAASIGCGGYGGLIDGDSVLWSSSFSQGTLLRYNLKSNTSQCITRYGSYGLGIDPSGNIWNSSYYGGNVTKYAKDGSVLGTYTTNGVYPRGVAATSNGDIWVANSNSSNVARLSNTGTLLKNIPVGATPTGVAVDANGKVWVTNYSSNSAMRIDPAAGTDGLGAVDMTVDLGSGAGPYNYSDMTGYVAVNTTAPQGTWTVVHDGGIPSVDWGKVSWNATLPTGTGIKVEIRAANAVSGLASQPWVEVQNGVSICAAPVVGQFAEVRATLSRSLPATTPVLSDLTLECCNRPPVAVCTNITLSADAACQAAAVAADVDGGCYDPDGNPITLSMAPAGPFVLGTTAVVLTVTDSKGAFSTCNATVTVEDVTAPVITVASEPVMWPANHTYETFTVSQLITSVADNCDNTLDAADAVITSVSSDEPEDAVGNGDGNTQDDILIGAGCKEVSLRKERAGSENGRVYTIHLAVTDASDVTGTAVIRVRVPKSNNGTPAVDDGAVYSESCGPLKRSAAAVSAAEGYALMQNYPNPFNPNTTIQFTLPAPGKASLAVYDAYSRCVAVLVDEQLAAGAYAIPFDAGRLSSGTYFYRLEVNGVRLMRMMNVMK